MRLLWIAFICTVVLVVLWFTADAAYKHYHYNAQSHALLPGEINWSIEKKADDLFLHHAAFSYNIDNKSYKSHTVLRPPIYRNAWAAREALPSVKEKEWRVWYNPTYPEQSTIQKNFPYKEWVYATALWAVLLYFFWLGRRIAEQK